MKQTAAFRVARQYTQSVQILSWTLWFTPSDPNDLTVAGLTILLGDDGLVGPAAGQ